MTLPIVPALTPGEWRQFFEDGKDQFLPRYFAQCAHANLMAKHNAALPDDHPQKLTREMVDDIRDAVQAIEAMEDDRDVHPRVTARSRRESPHPLHAIANVLASLLPPRTL